MEAVPRMEMLSLELKQSSERVEFSTILKKYINEHYMEDASRYNDEIRQIEQLRVSATNVAQDFGGLSTLKKYYGQLHLLTSRFPMAEGEASFIQFTWVDAFDDTFVTEGDIHFEQASILYNLGTLHSILGAKESRTSEEEMKVACTHFQCAAGVFTFLRDHVGSNKSPDISMELLQIYINLMLGQAQECLLEKSMQDNRKSSLVARISSQVRDYYKLALKGLDDSRADIIVGSRRYKHWKKVLQIKVAHFTCISYMYMGNQAEEQQKYGERVSYLKAAVEKHSEAVKLAKGQKEGIAEALIFTKDVVVGKHESAKKDNDFIYHDKIPDIDSLPDIKGASLVKALTFQPYDATVAGPDIFKKLVPMEAHAAASVYSEEKAKLLRELGAKIDEKNNQLDQYLESLQVDQLRLQKEPERLPQVLLEVCAAISVKPDAVKSLVESMNELSNVVLDVDAELKEVEAIVLQEKEEEQAYSKEFGSKPVDVTKDFIKELKKYKEGHTKASQSNSDLHKAMEVHLANIRLLAGPLDELQAVLPSQNDSESTEDQGVQDTLKMLIEKVEKMKSQRKHLEKQLREKLQDDDITSTLVTKEEANRKQFFEEELAKHQTTVTYIEQNLSAQDNILKAVTEANARYADTRKMSADIAQRREDKIQELVMSYTVYDDLLAKSHKGIDFYKKLQTGIMKIHTNCTDVVKDRQELRNKHIARFKPKPNFAPRQQDPGPAGPRLSDFWKPKTSQGSSGSPVHTPSSQGMFPSSAAVTGASTAGALSGMQPSPALGGVSKPTGHSQPGSMLPQPTPRSQSQSHISGPTAPPPSPARNSPTTLNNAMPHMNVSSQQNVPQASIHQAPPTHRPNAPVQHPPVSMPPNSMFQPPVSMQHQIKHPPTSMHPSNVRIPGASTLMPHPVSSMQQPVPSMQATASMHQPTTSVHQPGTMASMHQPVASVHQPMASMHQPASSMHQPVPSMHQPTASMHHQVASMHQPVTSMHQPASSMHQPVPSMHQPSTSVHQPTSSIHQPNASVHHSRQQPIGVPPTNYQQTYQPSQMATPAQLTRPPMQTSHIQQVQPTTLNTAYQPQIQAPVIKPNQNQGLQQPTSMSPQHYHAHQQLSQQNMYQQPSQPLSSSQPQNQYLQQQQPHLQQPLPLQNQTPGQTNVAFPNPNQQTGQHYYQNMGSPHGSPQHRPRGPQYVASQANIPGGMGQTTSQSAGFSHTSNQLYAQQHMQTYQPQQTSVGAYQPPQQLPSQPQFNQPQMYSQQPMVQSNAQIPSQNPQLTPISNKVYQQQKPTNVAQPNQQQQQMQQQQPFPNQVTNQYSTANQTGLQQPASQIQGKYQSQQPTTHPSQATYHCQQPTAQPAQATYNIHQTGTQPVQAKYPNQPLGVQQNQNAYPNQQVPMQMPPPSQSPTPTNAALQSGKPTPQPRQSLGKKSAGQPSIQNIQQLEQQRLQQPLQPTKATAPKQPDLLSTSPDDNQQKSLENVLVPKKSEVKPEPEERPMRIIKMPASDPYNDKENLDRFLEEVEKLEKYVEGLNKQTLSGPTVIDSLWRELTESQDRDTRQYSISIARCYSMKNRYPDFMPYDHNRVRLKGLKDDYINASYLDDLTPSCPTIIATQAPTSMTMLDFWTMVYENQVSVIAMLISKPHGKTKSDFVTYWPEQRGQIMRHGPISVTLQATKMTDYHIERLMTISHRETRQMKTFAHLQFTAWPEFGVPTNSSSVLQFVGEVLNYHRQQRNTSLPIVVHCNGGVGRTGTFCTILAGVQEILAGSGIIDVVQVIKKQRQQRKWMVLEKEQLSFCFGTILCYAEQILTKRGIYLHPIIPTHDKKKPPQRFTSFDPILGVDSIDNLQSKISQMNFMSSSSDTVEKSEKTNNDISDAKNEPTAFHSTEASNTELRNNQKVGNCEDAANIPSGVAVGSEPNDNLNSKQNYNKLEDANSIKSNESVFPNAFPNQPLSVDSSVASLIDSNDSVGKSLGTKPASLNTLQEKNLVDFGQSMQNFVPSELDQKDEIKLAEDKETESSNQEVNNLTNILTDLDPQNFSLKSENPKQKITKADFFSSKSKLGQEGETDDPLSLLDPLWTLKSKPVNKSDNS